MPSFFKTASLLATTLTSIAAAVPLRSPVIKRDRSAQIAVYYGQGFAQPRLNVFCDDPDIDIIPVGFVNGWPKKEGNGGWPSADFGNQCGGTEKPGTNMFMSCSQLVEDVAYCHTKGKKILISIGGHADSSQVLASDADGEEFADYMWHMFGPTPAGWDGPRPFGANVVDGFDFDVEGNGNVGYGAMAKKLRANMAKDDPNGKYLLTAAPQCPTPDAQLGDAISKADFDYLFIQFYNTKWCSARAGIDHTYGSADQNGGKPTDISFVAWAEWVASNAAGSPSLFIGLPGSTTALTDPSMYLNPDDAQTLLNLYCPHPSFGGIMVWEATAAKNNDNFVGSMKKVLDQCACGPNACQSTTTTTTTTIAPTTTTTLSTTASTTTTAAPTTTTTPSTTASTSTTTASSASPTISTTTSSSSTSPAISSTTSSEISSTTTTAASSSTTTATSESSTTTTSSHSTPPFGSSTTSSETTSAATTSSASSSTSTTSESSTTTFSRPTSLASSSTTTSETSSVPTTTGESLTSTTTHTHPTPPLSSSTTSESSSATHSHPTGPLGSSTTFDSSSTTTTYSHSTSPFGGPTSSYSNSATTTSTFSRLFGSSTTTETTSPAGTSTTNPGRPSSTSESSSSSGKPATTSISSEWGSWPSTSSVSQSVDPTSSSSSAEHTWAPWSTTSTSSRPVDPTTSSSSPSEQTWAPWSTTSTLSRPVDPTTSSSGSTGQTWTPWSTTSSKPVDPTSSTAWSPWPITPSAVYVTSTTTVYTDVCPTGFTRITATITATVTVTDVVHQPTGKDAPWPTGPAGVPTGFYATTTVCSTGCATTPVTVTITIPVPTGAITKTVVPTAATPATESGKPNSSAAVSTPVQAASGKPSVTVSGSDSGSAWATGSPVGDYSNNSNLNGVKAFTGGAAVDQAPATAFSVAVCIVLAVAGLVL